MGENTLLDTDFVRRRFLRVAFAGSHGADGDDLGVGLLYYAFARLVRARVAVCIGSGGGFVPALMAQAQLDQRIGESRTYLVDAVLPELAFGSPLQSGGWLANGNDILEHYPQMRLMRLLSVDAAKLFARNGIEIDYLHIDGDHSKEGVRADLDAYLPILSSGGVVTLHDSSQRPVADAIKEFVAANPRFELLSFPEIGAGTTVLRAPPAASHRSLGANRQVDIGAEAIDAAEKHGEPAIRFERWRYLATDTYRLRYTLAAEWLDEDGATIVEIGGYPNSIVGCLTKARRLVAVEPYAPTAYVDAIAAEAAQRGVDFTLIKRELAGADVLSARLGNFRLVALGLDLMGGATTAVSHGNNVAALYRLLAASDRFAVEWPDAVRTGELWLRLAEWLGVTVGRRLSLDLSEDPVAEQFHVQDRRAVRNLVMGAVGVARPFAEIEEQVRALGDKLFRDVREVVERAEPILAFGETVKFRRGEDSAKYLGFGWSRLEGEFVHALGDESDIIFRWSDADLSRVSAASNVVVSMTLMPVVAPNCADARKIELWLGEHLIYQGAVAQRFQVQASIAASLVSGPEAHALRLLHRDRVRPSDIRKGSEDARLLSVSLIDLRIGPGTGSFGG